MPRLSKKPSAFQPFMQEFFAFTHVTVRTGNNQIGGIVGTATTQGDNMIDMVVFAYICLAIIAFAILSLVLQENVLSSMGSFTVFQTCAPSAIGGFCLFGMGAIVLMHMFWVSQTPTFLQLMYMVSICIAILFVFYPYCFTSRVIVSFASQGVANFAESCSVIRIKMLICCWLEFIAASTAFIAIRYGWFGQMFSVACGPTISTIRIQSIAQVAVANEIFKCCGLFLLALSTAFVSGFYGFRDRCFTRTILLAAFFAIRLQVIFGVFVGTKIARSSRQVLFAASAAFLGYNGVHDKACSLSSRQRMFPASLWQNIIGLNYSTSPFMSQIKEVCYS